MATLMFRCVFRDAITIRRNKKEIAQLDSNIELTSVVRVIECRRCFHCTQSELPHPSLVA